MKIQFMIYILLTIKVLFAGSCDVFDSNNQSLNIFESDDSIKTYINTIELVTQTITNIQLDNSSIIKLFKKGNGGYNFNSMYSAKDQDEPPDPTLILKIRFNTALKICCTLLNKNLTNIVEYEIRLLDERRNYNDFSFKNDENLYTNLAENYLTSGLDLIIKSTKNQETPTNVEIYMFRCRQIDQKPSSSPMIDKILSLNEANSFTCLQDKDCQSNFDSKMSCFNEQCICPIAYRMMFARDQFSTQAKCVKALTGASITVPDGCEIPYCNLQLLIFFHADNSNKNNLVSLNLINDHHYYLNEYFEISINNERLARFFIDSNDNPRLFLTSSHLRALIDAQSNLNNEKSATFSKRSRREPRYIINTFDDGSLLNQNSDKSNSNNFLHVIDPYEEDFIKKYISFSFYNQGNLTYYNLNFDQITSNYLLSLMALQDLNLSIMNFNVICTENIRLIKANFIQINWSDQSKLAIYFDSKPLLKLYGLDFCFMKNSTINLRKQSVACNKNGHVIFTALRKNNNKYYCLCMNGYLGSNCDQMNPCYAVLSKSSTKTSELSFKKNKLCENDGLCLPKLASAAHFIRTGQKYVPYCMCKPQYTGNQCETNLDSCSFPFLYEGSFYNKCFINSTDGTPWCAKDSKNFDIDKKSVICQNLPCKTPFKYKSSFYFDKCLHRKFNEDSKERAFCSLTRNYDLFKSWRLCQQEDIGL
jgi:hypothetical protein